MGNKIVFGVCVFLAFLLFSVFPGKEADAGEPIEQVKQTVNAVIQILNDRELRKPERLEERRAKIRQAVEKSFDFEEMAKRSMALHWRVRTPEERKEFISLFSDLLEDVYIRKIERYEDEKVLYTNERTDGRYATVSTVVVTAQDTEIPVHYRTLNKKGKWEVYDIVIEGVSLVNTYRSQFNQIIRSGSYEELVSRLRKKTVN